jgi:hypothetical protein
MSNFCQQGDITKIFIVDTGNTGSTGTDIYVTGGTYFGGTLTLGRNDGVTIPITGFSTTSIFTGNTSASCITDLYITNLHGCSPITIWDPIVSLSSISATTYYGDGSNLSGIPDYYVTGGTYSNGSLTLNRQNGSVFITGFTTSSSSGGTGVAGNNDVGVMYLKNNTTATTITTINERKVVEGNIQTGILSNFIKDPSTNSLKYTGLGGRFHIVTTFNFNGGARDIYGFYIGKNTNDATPLDPNADRISESEVYINSNQLNDQPAAGAIQTVLDLNTNDRVFFIVQNRETTSDITVEFMKFVVTSITAEKGVSGSTGPAGPAGGGLKYFSSASSGETVIGTTNNTFTKALFVPANSYTTDDVPEVSVRARRVTGTTGTGAYTTRLYWNTSPSISGSPVLLAVSQSVTNINNSSFMSRNIAIVDATSLSNVTDLAGGYSTDAGTNGNGTIVRAPSDVVVDWTQDGYLVVAITFTSSLGSAYCNLIKIR